MVHDQASHPDAGEPSSADRLRSAGDQQLVVVRADPFNAEAPLCALRTSCTPTQQFYVRSNFNTPTLDQQSWRLQLAGFVEPGRMFTFDELRRLPSRRFTATLECAGNNRIGFAPLPKGEPWDTGAVSTATWRGVSLSTIIHQAGLQPSTVEILFNGADHGRPHDHDQEVQFGRSLPLAKALDPDTLLVYEMNDEPLTPEHGGPVRLLVPDWYGMASVKWLTGITALDHPFTGYFQTKRYVYQLPDQAEPVPVCTMQVKSLIIAPEPGVTLPPGRHVISGLAWSGAGAIRAVEVSVGGDCGWQTAQLWDEEQAYTWRRWVWTWEVREPGRHVLRVRATDEQGNTQPDVAPWNRLGYGNNAVRSTVVYIRD